MRPAPSDYRISHTDPTKGVTYDAHYISDPHDRILWRLEQQILGECLDTRLRGKEIHLLDFACGTGRVTHFLEPRVTSSVGVDVSAAMLDQARRKLKRTRLVLADLTQQNVLSGQHFRLITAFRFFVNAEPSLRENVIGILASLLTDDGYLIFNNHHNRTMPWWTFMHIRNRGKIARKTLNVMTLHEMRQLASKAGLQIVSIFHAGILPPPITRAIPESWAFALENKARRLRWLAPFAADLIAVCQLRGTSHAPWPKLQAPP